MSTTAQAGSPTPTPARGAAARQASARTGRAGPRTAVVIGAGVSGLATAGLLAREGLDVTVLEAREDVGGRAATWSADGFRFDLGPSWYLMPEVFDHWFRLMGTTAAAELELVRLDPAYRVFYEHHAPVDVHSDLERSVALFERVEPGAGGRLRKYLASASDAYSMAVRHFLYPTYRTLRPLLTWPVLRRTPELLGLLGTSLQDRIDATVTDVRLRQVLGYPAVFLGASPRIAPAMYHLMSHLDLVDGVLYPQGGFGEVVAALRRAAERAGARVVTGADVATITTTIAISAAGAGGAAGGRVPRLRRRRAARATGVVYRQGGATHTLRADLVVSTADLAHTEHDLLPTRLRWHPDLWWRRQVPGPSAVMVYLGVSGALPDLPHHSLFLAEDWDATFDAVFPPRAGRTGWRGRLRRGGREARPVGAPFPDPTSVYVSRVSATDPGAAPAGHENLVILVPVPPDVRLGGGGLAGAGDPWVERVADAALAQVSAWACVPDLADRVVLRRTLGPADWARDLRSWRGTALGPAHTVRQSAMFRAGNATPVDGLLLAGGSVLPGIGVPMCLISAELVLKHLRGDESAGPLPEPTPVGTGGP
jgi:phytoene desaturase